MRKFIGLIFAMVLFLSGAFVIHAQTVAPTAVPSKKPEQGVEKLRDTIESKVAELVSRNKKAVAGTATVVTATNITLAGSDGQTYKVKIDKDLTHSYSITGTTKKEVEAQDFEKGAYLIVTGPLTDREITANTIYEDEEYIVESGKITEVDKGAFVIRVMTKVKDEYLLDIEATTKQNLVNSKSLELEVTGFTKIKEGDGIHFVASKAGKTGGEKNRYTPVRILIIPQEYFVQ